MYSCGGGCVDHRLPELKARARVLVWHDDGMVEARVVNEQPGAVWARIRNDYIVLHRGEDGTRWVREWKTPAALALRAARGLA